MQSGCSPERHPGPPQWLPQVTPARRDIDHQRECDETRPTTEAVLWARMRAVVGAREAVDAEAIGAAPAWRQSLVDLAAVAETIAATLEAPTAR